MNDNAQKIIEEATKLIARNGFHGSPTSDIARNAALGVGTIYRHFGSKEELIFAIHAEIHQEIRNALFEHIDSSLSTKENFLHFFSTIGHFFARNEDKFHFLEQFYCSPFGIDPKGRQRNQDLAKEIFRKGKENGSIRQLDDDLLIALSIGPLLYLLREHFAGFSTASEVEIDAAILSIWEAIKQ